MRILSEIRKDNSMGKIITVDCGTTNMRCRLYEGRDILCEARRKVGTRNTAFDGNNSKLKQGLRECIEEILEKQAICADEVEAVVSSGTLSSDVGIYRVPHVALPIGEARTAAHAKMVHMPEITSIPILFIPGVKSLPPEGETDEERIVEYVDSMSGEECEMYGLRALMGIEGPFSITLPGSYNKAFEVDENGTILSMYTGMCGEFIAAMSEHTLLRHALPDPVIRQILPEKLIFGFEYSRRHGVSPSLIKARNVQIWHNWTQDEAANLFVGAILADDILLAKNIARDDRPLIVGGGNPLRSIFVLLLNHVGVKNIVEVDDEIARIAPNIGAMRVYRKYLELNSSGN